MIDFDNVQKSADVVEASGNTLLNSLRFNEVDWTIVVRKELTNLIPDNSGIEKVIP